MAALAAGARRRARHPVRGGFPPRRPAAGGDADDRRRARGGLGRRSAWPSWRRCPTCACMPRTTVFGVYDGGTYGAVERVDDHVAAPPALEPRQRCWRIVAKRAVLAAGAHRAADRRSPTTTGPASCWRRRRAHLRQSLRRRAGPARRSCSPRATTAGARRTTWREPASSVEAVVDPRANARQRRGRALARALPAARSRRRTAGTALAASRPCATEPGSSSTSPATCSRCRAAGTRRCTSPATSAHKPVWNEASPPSCRRPRRPAWRSAAQPRAASRLGECLADGARLGAASGNRRGFAASPSPPPAVEPELGPIAEPLWPSPAAAPRPSSTSRTT